jgi:hypothetical protein
MIHPVRGVRGAPIRATDGRIGSVRTFLFDDSTWTIRYLVVDTGRWLLGKQVLISPQSLGRVDWRAGAPREFPVTLSRDHVANAPDIDTDRPVSRQHEAEFNAYYGLAPYWTGPFLWGPYPYPGGLAVPPPSVLEEIGARQIEIQRQGDSHLRSIEEVTGYAVGASDGEIGHVEDFLVDDATWTVRALVVDTRNWWPGRKVVVPPAAVERVDWGERTVFLTVDREHVRSAPEYDPGHPIDAALDARLEAHYGRAAGPPGRGRAPEATG